MHRIVVPPMAFGALLGTEWEDRLQRHSSVLMGDWFEASVTDAQLAELRLDLDGALEQIAEAESLTADPGELETLANLAESVRWAIRLLPTE